MSTQPLLPQHNRYDFVPLTERRDYSWPGGKRLAFVITTNVEWFAFGAGLGHDPARLVRTLIFTAELARLGTPAPPFTAVKVPAGLTVDLWGYAAQP